MLLFSTLTTVNAIEIAFAVDLTSSNTINGSSSNANSNQCTGRLCEIPSLDTEDSSINGSSSNANSNQCTGRYCEIPSTY